MSFARGPFWISLKSSQVPYKSSTGQATTDLHIQPNQMSFGFAPAISFSPFGFDHGFFDESPFDSFFNVPQRHYFARNGLRPRRFRGETCAPLSGRCVPWRRVARPAPSIFDLISFGSDFDRFWDALDQEHHEVPKIEESKEKKALSSSSASSPAALPSTASATASPSPSEVSNSKASSEVATTAADASSLKKKAFSLGEVDVKREPSATHYDVHLPGLSLGDIKLDFDFKRHALYVKAEKKVEESKEDKHGKRSFVRHVSISRALPLPDGVKPEDVKADFVDNVLSISVAHKAIEAPTDAPLSTSLPISDASSLPSKPDEVTSTAPIEASAPVSDASPSESVPESTPVSSSETSSASPEEVSASTSSSVTEKKDEDSATVEDAE